MKLGKHAPQLHQALITVNDFHKVKQQILRGDKSEKEIDFLANKLHYTCYAVAVQVLVNHWVEVDSVNYTLVENVL